MLLLTLVQTLANKKTRYKCKASEANALLKRKLAILLLGGAMCFSLICINIWKQTIILVR